MSSAMSGRPSEHGAALTSTYHRSIKAEKAWFGRLDRTKPVLSPLQCIISGPIGRLKSDDLVLNVNLIRLQLKWGRGQQSQSKPQ